MKKIQGSTIRKLSKGLLSVADQGLFSGTNFIVSLLLGRWLLPNDYGSYSVAMSVFLLASGVYTAIVLEPMSVLGSKSQQGQAERYPGSILVMHIITTVGIAFILLFSTFFPFLGFGESTSSIRVMTLTIPFVLAIWLLRWRFYTQSEPFKALKVSAFYAIGFMALVILLKISGFISSEITILISGLIGLIISLFVLRTSYKQIGWDAVIRHVNMHWGYGKWIVVASILQWFSTQFYLLLVSTSLSLGDGAGYRAVQNLAQPLEQVSVALGLLLTPWFSRKFANDSSSSLQRIPWVNVILGLLGFAYLAAAWLGSDFLVNVIYQGKYNSYAWLVPYLVCVPLIMSLSKGAQIGVRVLEKPSSLLYAYMGTAVVTVLLGPMLINTYGLIGAAAGRLLSAVIYSILIAVLYRRNTKAMNGELPLSR